MRQSITSAAAALLVDAVTAEAMAALQRSEIPSILLRGPAIGHRLYDSGEVRRYGDGDVLVPPSSFGEAERVLQRNGFREARSERVAGAERPGHAHTWVSADSAIAVDLHATLIGIGAPPQILWDAFSRDVESLEVAGAAVRIPSEPATALVVALHAWQHAALPEPPLEDLRRAIDRLPQSTWLASADLAKELDAVIALTAGLRMVSGGDELAVDLGLGRIPVGYRPALRGSQAFHIAQGLDWLTREHGARAKLAFVYRKWLPPPARMRALYPVARRGAGGLVASYLWRTGSLVWHTPRALVLRRRMR